MTQQSAQHILHKHLIEDWKTTTGAITLSLGLLVAMYLFLGGFLFYASPAVLALFAMNPLHSVRKFPTILTAVLYEAAILLPATLFLFIIFNAYTKAPQVFLALFICLLTYTLIGRLLDHVHQLVLTILMGIMVLFGGMISLNTFPTFLQWVAMFNPLYFATQALFISLNGLGALTYGQALMRQVLLVLFYFSLFYLFRKKHAQ